MATNAQYLASLVNSSGNIVLPVANAGIVFNNTNTPASPTSTTQNDYETGTFTPTIGGSSTFGTTTYGSVNTEYNGYYTKIGNMVFVQITFNILSVSGGSGNILVSSLPFVSASSPAPYGSCSLGTINNVTHSGSRTQFAFRTNPGAANATMWEFGLASGAIGDQPVPYGSLCAGGGASNITMELVYRSTF